MTPAVTAAATVTEQLAQPSVDAQMHAFLLRQVPRSLWVNVPVALITFAVAAQRMDWAVPLVWCLTVITIQALRGIAIKQGYHSNRQLQVGALISGLAWGCSNYIAPGLVDESMRLFLAVILSGMTASALLSLGANTVLYWCFAVPCWTSIFIGHSYAGGSIGYGIAAMSIAYGSTLSVYAPVVYQTIRRGIELGDSNLTLVNSLTEQRNQAERQREQRTRFLAVASHDLRQPAHAISLIASYLDTLLKRDEPMQSQAWRVGLDRLRAGSSNMNALLDDLLDLTRLQLQAETVDLSTVAITPLIDRLHTRFADEAARKHLRLRVKIKPGLHALSNAAMLERMVGNLVSNAIRYTDRGGILLVVRQRSEFVEIHVLDTGRGIAEADHQRIFEEFVQLGDAPRDKGAGLGLAIVSQSAQLLQHQLLVQSKLHRGSRFCIRMQHATPLAVIVETPRNDARLQAGRVLILDDDPLVLDALSGLLNARDWQVSKHADLASAREAVFEFAPDFLLLDVHLITGSGGIDALRTLRHELDQVVPAILMTGDELDAIQPQLPEQAALLRKPIETAVMWRTMQQLLATPTTEAQATSGPSPPP